MTTPEMASSYAPDVARCEAVYSDGSAGYIVTLSGELDEGRTSCSRTL